jgi:hypothetical protein
VIFVFFCKVSFSDAGLRIRAAHAKEVGVEDPAEETSAARILLLLTTAPPLSQTRPGRAPNYTF